jgi:hypothetical protein
MEIISERIRAIEARKEMKSNNPAPGKLYVSKKLKR